MKKYTAFLILLLSVGVLAAQNTIGGQKKEVPEEEVERQTQFLTAESFRMLGKYDKAIGAYKKFLYTNDHFDAAWYGLARSYTEQKEYGTALDAIDKAILHNPDNKWYYIHKADIYEKNGQITNAADVYELLAKKNPKTPEFLEQLAYLSILSENPKRGLKALDQLEALTGISEITASKKHLVYLALGDKAKAANEIRRLVNAYPSQLDYKRRLAHYYAEIDDKSAEKEVWNEIFRQDPTDAEAKLALLAKPGKSNSAAAAKLQALLPFFNDPTVNIDTKIKELTPYLGQLNANTEAETINGLLALGAALEKVHSDDAKSWSVSGDLYYLIDRNEAALIRYKKCIDLRPKVFSVWDNALEILRDQKKYPEMKDLAEKAIDAFPNQPKGYLWYGTAANALNQPAEAIATLDQATLMCGNNTALLTEVVDQIGIALLVQKKYDDLITRYDKLLPKGADKNPDFLEHYGDAMAGKGNRTQAIDWWKKAKTIRSTPALEQKIMGGQ